ncbi:hypothetical protein ACFVYT_08440 [Streptomyces sp. NPDC058290]|uniref:hypothetical protein n=1 Tax=Streptomyces sp. NPDC058290 TaxID=3346426 RepID=UPI0036E49F2A
MNIHTLTHAEAESLPEFFPNCSEVGSLYLCSPLSDDDAIAVLSPVFANHLGMKADLYFNVDGEWIKADRPEYFLAEDGEYRCPLHVSITAESSEELSQHLRHAAEEFQRAAYFFVSMDRAAEMEAESIA